MLFSLPVIAIGAAAAIHSTSYMKNHGNLAVYWGFFNLTLATMLQIPVTGNFAIFLLLWEGMGLFSAVLVMSDYRDRKLFKPVWSYLLACEAGGLLLMLFYARGGVNYNAGNALIFALGIAGFGLKAGLPMLHLWLPEAHPAAPAPVSALMSAAMINLGLFGILKFVWHGSFTLALGWTLLICGIIGAFGGILFAIAQDNLKRLLAYSSIENIGIICMALGVGFISRHYELFRSSYFAFAAAILHMLNHALLKGALFLGAGQIFCSTHTLSIDAMGGLHRRLPWTGKGFSLAAAALSGVPPFNAFCSELLLYIAGFGILTAGELPPHLKAGAVVMVLALAATGAVAMTAFVKAIGGVFLGESRTPQAEHAAKESPAMYSMVMVPALAAAALVFILPLYIPELDPVIAGFASYSYAADVVTVLGKVATAAMLLYLLTAAVLIIRFYCLPRSRKKADGITWDCGYAAPTARMEYTGSALVQPLTDYFRKILRPVTRVILPESLFPRRGAYSSETGDGGEKLFWKPLFTFTASFAELCHRLQSGYLHFYLTVMVAAVLALLAMAIFL